LTCTINTKPAIIKPIIEVIVIIARVFLVDIDEIIYLNR